MLLFYSMSGIFSKLASGCDFLSPRFILYYGIMILILAFYALAWQQIIKQIPLTTAYANRAITVVWGALWGCLFFHEQLSWKRILGIALVVCGVVLFALSDQNKDGLKGEN